MKKHGTIITIVVVVLLIAGVAAWFFFRKKKKSDSASAEEKPSGTRYGVVDEEGNLVQGAHSSRPGSESFTPGGAPVHDIRTGAESFVMAKPPVNPSRPGAESFVPEGYRPPPRTGVVNPPAPTSSPAVTTANMKPNGTITMPSGTTIATFSTATAQNKK
jgi:LPXTG-motif cell wall-anchored protein